MALAMQIPIRSTVRPSKTTGHATAPATIALPITGKLGPVYYEHQEEHAFLGHRIAVEGGASDATIHTVEREARALLGAALKTAVAEIDAHRAELDRIRHALLEHETLEHDQLVRLLGQPHETSPTRLLVAAH